MLLSFYQGNVSRHTSHTGRKLTIHQEQEIPVASERTLHFSSLHSSCRTNNIAMVGELKGRFSSLHDKVGFHPAQSEILFQGLQNLPYLPSFHSAFRQQRGWGCCRAQACTQTTLTFWPLEEERWGWREPTFPLDPKPFCLLNMGMKAEQAP